MIKENVSLEKQLQQLIQQFAETASERDKQGGTAKAQRDLLRNSGLLSLMIPEQYGGYGENWQTAFHFTREIAKVDSSVAHLFGYHFLCLFSVELYGTQQQVANYLKETAANNYFWGNAFNPLDTHVCATKSDTGWTINGKKSFCSGATDSDRLLISAQKDDGSGVVIAVIPSNRAGVVIEDDWDSFGQRQTDSGSVYFEAVQVLDEEVLDAFQADDNNVFASMRTHIAQSILIHVLLGTAEGAFEAAIQYTQQSTRPWLTANVERAVDDPYHMHNYGTLWVKLKAAQALAKESNALIQETWDYKHNITLQQRGDCSIAVATTKIQVVETALEVTNRMFQMMGARATSAKYNFDRYWRNVRTHSLHDPIDYKIRDIGKFILTNQYPDITAYS